MWPGMMLSPGLPCTLQAHALFVFMMLVMAVLAVVVVSDGSDSEPCDLTRHFRCDLVA